MTEEQDQNARIIDEFRANEGKVGGYFEGAPMVLVHHRGRKSGADLIAPVMYYPDQSDPDTVYVFASKAGAPVNPNWYYNLMATGTGSVEIGTDSYPVTVRELSGDERDRIYAAHATLFPGFKEYERKTAGIRTIPVLALKKA